MFYEKKFTLVTTAKMNICRIIFCLSALFNNKFKTSNVSILMNKPTEMCIYIEIQKTIIPGTKRLLMSIVTLLKVNDRL